MTKKAELADVVRSYFEYLKNKKGKVIKEIGKLKNFIERYYDMKKHVEFYERLYEYVPEEVSCYIFAKDQKYVESIYSLVWYEKNKFGKEEKN